MGDVKGTAATVDVSVAGSSYTALGGVKDVSISIGHATIDVSDFDQPNWEEHLAGRGNMSLSVTCNYDEADAGQDIVRASCEASPATQIYYRYRPVGSSSGVGMEYIIKGTIDSLDDTSSDGSAAEMSFSVTATGAPTFQTQP